ncbi:hypothetical protein RRF57_000828 [Xylaria bambusicola]|uniref:Uncharacterized protein n=1 Tax=Xylaria bambusicola TaxID=326684 RepID=A0AAN7Z028_9PEZI
MLTEASSVRRFFRQPPSTAFTKDIQPQNTLSPYPASGSNAVATSGLPSSLSSSTSEVNTTTRSIPSHSLEVDVTYHTVQCNEDPFRDPIQIPNASPPIFVYPHSPSLISDAFQKRYYEVVNIFRQNTEEHSTLKEHIQHIDYTLKMCGPSVNESHPSILVFCRPKEFGSLSSLLLSKHLKFQYCLRRSSSKYSWKGWQRNQSNFPEDRSKPLFNLYFWCQKRPRILLGCDQVRVFIKSETDTATLTSQPDFDAGLTLCGSTISVSPGGLQCSTIGCIVEIGSDLYALTAAHAIRPSKLYSNIAEANDNNTTLDTALHDAIALLPGGKRLERTATTGNDHMQNGVFTTHSIDRIPLDETYENDDYIIDDVTYDIVSDAGEDDESIDGNRLAANDRAPETRSFAPGQEALAFFPEYHNTRDFSSPDLDWAAIPLKEREQWRPNAFVSVEDPSHPMFLTEVAATHPRSETRVLIITSSHTARNAMLQPVSSVLGGINGSRASKVWSAIMTDNDSISKGDSGSIVIDAQTGVIYGHVIASNPLQEVYISPLAATLIQISSCFLTTAVSLPKPLSLLTSLATLCLEKKQDARAVKLLTHLDSLIRSMEDEGQTSALASWRNSNEREALSTLIGTLWGGKITTAEEVCL